MKHNVSFKKYLLISLSITILFIFIFSLILNKQYQSFTKNYNYKINTIIQEVNEKYPDMKKEDIIKILNSNVSKDDTFLKDYGININEESLVLKNDYMQNKYFRIDIILIIIFFSIIISLSCLYNYLKNRKIKEITKLIEQINHKNYALDISNNAEGALSILQNEIYKTTIMLKEQAEHERIDKYNLKNSLEDISHQLKTPLTSINIMLDNLIDNPDMDTTTKIDFIMSIKREINNINFLIISLLKLSKFDANVIKFNNEEIVLNKVVAESIKNVLALCDLKNIKIKIFSDEDIKIIGDFSWQVEAITNIIKNAIEYSKNNSQVDIYINQNKAYTKLIIRDYGEKIDYEDQRHIFERFYKGQNTSNHSFGIGLALSKSIIENNNGIIKVESSSRKTDFIIKYFNN